VNFFVPSDEEFRKEFQVFIKQERHNVWMKFKGFAIAELERMEASTPEPEMESEEVDNRGPLDYDDM
jgi:hypothetical protein